MLQAGKSKKKKIKIHPPKTIEHNQSEKQQFALAQQITE